MAVDAAFASCWLFVAVTAFLNAAITLLLSSS